MERDRARRAAETPAKRELRLRLRPERHRARGAGREQDRAGGLGQCQEPGQAQMDANRLSQQFTRSCATAQARQAHLQQDAATHQSSRAADNL